MSQDHPRLTITRTSGVLDPPTRLGRFSLSCASDRARRHPSVSAHNLLTAAGLCGFAAAVSEVGAVQTSPFFHIRTDDFALLGCRSDSPTLFLMLTVLFALNAGLLLAAQPPTTTLTSVWSGALHGGGRAAQTSILVLGCLTNAAFAAACLLGAAVGGAAAAHCAPVDSGLVASPPSPSAETPLSEWDAFRGVDEWSQHRTTKRS